MLARFVKCIQQIIFLRPQKALFNTIKSIYELIDFTYSFVR